MNLKLSRFILKQTMRGNLEAFVNHISCFNDALLENVALDANLQTEFWLAPARFAAGAAMPQDSKASPPGHVRPASCGALQGREQTDAVMNFAILASFLASLKCSGRLDMISLTCSDFQQLAEIA